MEYVFRILCLATIRIFIPHNFSQYFSQFWFSIRMFLFFFNYVYFRIIGTSFFEYFPESDIACIFPFEFKTRRLDEVTDGPNRLFSRSLQRKKNSNDSRFFFFLRIPLLTSDALRIILIIITAIHHRHRARTIIILSTH